MTSSQRKALPTAASALAAQLWPPVPTGRRDERPPVYALLDAARDERIFDALLSYQDEVEMACLYQGRIAEELSDVAPYIVRLEPGHSLTELLMETGWGRGWAVFLQARSDLDGMRRHFRKFTMVWAETGESLIFRFYDPRVLRVFLPTCGEADLAKLFGPVERFLVEDEDHAMGLRLEYREGRLVSLPVTLVPAVAVESASR